MMRKFIKRQIGEKDGRASAPELNTPPTVPLDTSGFDTIDLGPGKTNHSFDPRVSFLKSAGSKPILSQSYSRPLLDPALFDPTQNLQSPAKMGDTTPPEIAKESTAKAHERPNPPKRDAGKSLSLLETSPATRWGTGKFESDYATMPLPPVPVTGSKKDSIEDELEEGGFSPRTYRPGPALKSTFRPNSDVYTSQRNAGHERRPSAPGAPLLTKSGGTTRQKFAAPPGPVRLPTPPSSAEEKVQKRKQSLPQRTAPESSGAEPDEPYDPYIPVKKAEQKASKKAPSAENAAPERHDPLFNSANESAFKKYNAGAAARNETIAVGSSSDLQGETAEITDYEGSHQRYETVDQEDWERFKQMSLKPETMAATAAGGLKVENEAGSIGSSSPRFENESSKSLSPHEAQSLRTLKPMRETEAAARSSAVSRQVEAAVKYEDSDSDSDDEFVDDDIDRSREAFYAMEIKKCIQNTNFQDLENVARRCCERKSGSKDSATYETEREAVWKLILALALFGQSRVQDCLDTLSQVHLSSGSSKKAGGGSGVSDDDIRAGICFATAAALMVQGRYEEARSKCQRAIRLAKSASTGSAGAGWTSEYLRVIAKDVTKPPPVDLANKPTELLALILEKSGNNLDARFYKSMLPKDYDQEFGIMTMIRAVDAEVARVGDHGLAKGEDDTMAPADRRALEKSLRECAQRVGLSAKGMTLEGAEADITWMVNYNMQRELDTPLMALLFTYPLKLADGKPLHAHRDNQGMTPLHVAAHWGALKTATKLVEIGAEITAKTNSGFTPLHLVAQHEGKDIAYPAIAELLLSLGAEKDHPARPTQSTNTENESTPILLLAATGNVGILEVFLRHDVDANNTVSSPTRRSALHIAVEKGHEDFIRMIANARGVNVCAQNAVKETPLHVAVKLGKPIIAGILLSAGASLNLKDDGGRTPMMCAEGLEASTAKQQLTELMGNWDSCKQQ